MFILPLADLQARIKVQFTIHPFDEEGGEEQPRTTVDIQPFCPRAVGAFVTMLKHARNEVYFASGDYSVEVLEDGTEISCPEMSQENEQIVKILLRNMVGILQRELHIGIAKAPTSLELERLCEEIPLAFVKTCVTNGMTVPDHMRLMITHPDRKALPERWTQGEIVNLIEEETIGTYKAIWLADGILHVQVGYATGFFEHFLNQRWWLEVMKMIRLKSEDAPNKAMHILAHDPTVSQDALDLLAQSINKAQLEILEDQNEPRD